MTSFFPLLLQQIDEELGEHSQVPEESRPVLLARFHRDMETEAYQVLLSEEERQKIYTILSAYE